MKSITMEHVLRIWSVGSQVVPPPRDRCLTTSSPANLHPRIWPSPPCPGIHLLLPPGGTWPKHGGLLRSAYPAVSWSRVRHWPLPSPCWLHHSNLMGILAGGSLSSTPIWAYFSTFNSTFPLLSEAAALHFHVALGLMALHLPFSLPVICDGSSGDTEDIQEEQPEKWHSRDVAQDTSLETSGVGHVFSLPFSGENNTGLGVG